jgi:hypothetical protein
MRSSRMRGYGSWCIGWNEGKNKNIEPPSNNNGCLFIFIIFVILLIISSFKASFQTGSPLGIIFGLAILAGLLKGLK